MKLHVRTTALEHDGALLALAPNEATETEPDVVWLQHGQGYIGWGTAARFDAGTGPERFARADAWVRDLASSAVVDDEVGVPGTGPLAFSSFTFTDHEHGSVVVVPDVLVGRRNGTTFVTTATVDRWPDEAPAVAPRADGPGPRHDRVRFAGSSKPDVLWLEAVAEAVKRLDAGDLEKVVLARDHAVWSQHPFRVDDLAWRLHGRFPGCFTFAVDGLVGATPELLIRRNGDALESLSLAGSAARGDDEASDEAIGSALFTSDKDRREHDLAARSVAAVLHRHSDDLVDPPEPHLLRLDNVQHLATRFTGTSSSGASALALTADLHPTAAVGGTPTDRAVALIAELEGMERGRYTGPVGWQDGAGNGEFGIALRCAQLAGARARLFAGAGIVRGSVPVDELEETRIKLLAMQRAFGD